MQEADILGVAFSPTSCLVPKGVTVGYGFVTAQARSLYSLFQPHPNPGALEVPGERGLQPRLLAGRELEVGGGQPSSPQAPAPFAHPGDGVGSHYGTKDVIT